MGRRFSINEQQASEKNNDIVSLHVRANASFYNTDPFVLLPIMHCYHIRLIPYTTKGIISPEPSISLFICYNKLDNYISPLRKISMISFLFIILFYFLNI